MSLLTGKLQFWRPNWKSHKISETYFFTCKSTPKLILRTRTEDNHNKNVSFRVRKIFLGFSKNFKISLFLQLPGLNVPLDHQNAVYTNLQKIFAQSLEKTILQFSSQPNWFHKCSSGHVWCSSDNHTGNFLLKLEKISFYCLEKVSG